MGSQQQFHSKTFQPKPAPPIQTASLTPRPFGNTHDTSTSALDGTPTIQAQLDQLRRRPSNLHRITPDIPKATIQPKLTVGAPNDQYEQEADRMADQVMSMPESAQPVQREAMPEEEDKLQPKSLAASITPLVQREEMPEDDQEVHAKAIAPIQREATSDEEEIRPKSLDPIAQREEVPDDEEQSLQMKAIANSDIQREAMSEDEDEMQRKPPSHSTLQRSTDGSLQAGGSIESRLNSSKGGGSPLSDEVRSFMEPRFGADFSQVRVHTNPEAVQMNQELGAQAFTHGNNIYFGAGKSPANSDLTAHELTHVVQQASPKSLSMRPSIQEAHAHTQMINCQEINADASTVVEQDKDEDTGQTTLVQQQVSVVVAPTTKLKLLKQFSTEISFNVGSFGLSPIEFSPTFKMKMESIQSQFGLTELAFKVKAKTAVDLVSPLSAPKFGLFMGVEGEYPLFDSKAAIFGSVGAKLKPTDSGVKFSPDASLGLKFFF